MATDGKGKPRASLTSQRDQAILLALRMAMDSEDHMTLFGAATKVMGLLMVPATPPSRAEEHWMNVIKTAMGAPVPGDEDNEDPAED